MNNSRLSVATGWLASRASRRSHRLTKRPITVYTRSTNRSTTLMNPMRPRGMTRVMATFTHTAPTSSTPRTAPAMRTPLMLKPACPGPALTRANLTVIFNLTVRIGGAGAAGSRAGHAGQRAVVGLPAARPAQRRARPARRRRERRADLRHPLPAGEGGLHRSSRDRGAGGGPQGLRAHRGRPGAGRRMALRGQLAKARPRRVPPEARRRGPGRARGSDRHRRRPAPGTHPAPLGCAARGDGRTRWLTGRAAARRNRAAPAGRPALAGSVRTRLD